MEGDTGKKSGKDLEIQAYFDSLYDVYDASGIDSLTEELVKILPQTRKYMFQSAEVMIAHTLSDSQTGTPSERVLFERITVYRTTLLILDRTPDPISRSWHSLAIGFTPDKSMVIAGDPVEGVTVLSESDWQSDRTRVEEAIVKAYEHPYINPDRHTALDSS